MSKPWDHLRVTVKPPIRSGEWKTSTGCAHVSANVMSHRVDMAFGDMKAPAMQSFWKGDLTELIEFLTELRDQIQ